MAVITVNISVADVYSCSGRGCHLHLDTAQSTLNDIVKFVAPLGLLVNAVYLYMFGRVRYIRTPVNIYFANASMADAAQLTISLLYATTQAGISGVFRIYLAPCLVLTAMLASPCFLAAAAVRRFLAVRRPLEYDIRAGAFQAFTVSARIWIAASVVGIARVLFVDSQRVLLAFVVVLEVVTLLLVICLYLWLAKRLLRRSSAVSATHRWRVNRVVVLLLLTTGAYVVLNIMRPTSAVFWLVLSGSNPSRASRQHLLAIHVTADAMSVVRCSLNPLVNGALNLPSLRMAFTEAFCLARLMARCCHGKPDAGRMDQIEMRGISSRATYASQTRLVSFP